MRQQNYSELCRHEPQQETIKISAQDNNRNYVKPIIGQSVKYIYCTNCTPSIGILGPAKMPSVFIRFHTVATILNGKRGCHSCKIFAF